MYTTSIQTSETALAHLFLHICFEDGVFTEAEIDNVSEKFADLGLHKDLNFKDELRNYRSYKNSIGDEKAYVQYLISLIKPTNEFALYSYCVDLSLSDQSLDVSEKNLLEIIANVLEINEEEQNVIQKLMVQREVVKTQKYF
ncbi:MAG: TerB family tellurite resistance protein [Chitinophagaceae bacterium]